ncbi:MAG TPA: hypothetical protein PLX89_22800 [Verrucomicrobiota bacterium]|nr:hypothetical protein [Verrucomicrobiota bacterium]
MNTHNFGALPGDTPWQFAQFLEPAIPFSRTAETELNASKTAFCETLWPESPRQR